MSNKKIWFAPIAALALVLMLVAVVFASAKPQVGVQIANAEITVGTGSSTPATQPSLTDADGPTKDGNDDDDDAVDPAFTDSDDTTLAYTAATSNERVADVGLSGGTTDIVTEWWNGLGADGTAVDTDCSKRAAVLGFTAGAGIRGNVPNNANPHRAGLPETTSGANDAVQATGLCADWGAASAVVDNPRTVTVEDNWNSSGVAIIDAFHWDMLSGTAMAAVATTADQTSPNDFKKTYGKLTAANQTVVSGWFNTGYLAKGTGTLAVSNDGIDDTAPHGKAGTATIYVSASDADGRFGADSVNQSFQVTAKLTNAPTLPEFGSGDALAKLVASTGNHVQFKDASESADDDITTDRFEVRVSPGATEIATVNLGNNYSLGGHQQAITFSLTNGGNVKFDVNQESRAITAKIQTKPGVTLTSGPTDKFTLVVNEIGRAPQNTKQVDVWVIVVLDNVAPVIVNPASTGTVAERAKGATVATFTATDANNQVIRWSIDQAGMDLGLEIGADGVLKTSSKVETPTDQPDFVEDDPDTTKDESMNCGDDKDESCNVHDVVVTASDGTLKATHTITITVTDEDDPAQGHEQMLTVEEGEGPKVVGSPPDLGLTQGDWEIGNQVVDGNFTLVEADILFEIDNDEDKIMLKKGKSLDFEVGRSKRIYTLSISRTDTSTDPDTVRSGIVTIEVTDVNEAPAFVDSDGDSIVKNDSDGNPIPFELVAIEGTTVGTIVKIGTDSGGAPTTKNATFMATDPDSAATGNDTKYDLWYDADATDDDTAHDDAYTGADALVTVDASGNIKVNSELDADNGASKVSLTLRAYDGSETVAAGADRKLVDTIPLTFEILDTNVAPTFDDTTASPLVLHKNIPETAGDNYLIATYNASDLDGTDASEGVNYVFRNADDVQKFTITTKAANGNGEIEGALRVKAGANLDVDAAGAQTLYVVELKVCDSAEACNQIAVNVNVDDVNDEAPMFATDNAVIINVMENTARDTALTSAIAADGVYAAPDADSTAPNNTVTYKIDHKSFKIDPDTGKLTTLESLDADTGTPCGATGCSFKITATDGGTPAKSDTLDVTVIVGGAEDSVSTFSVSKANPVPGISMGDPDSALSDTKTGMMGIPERPKDQPAVANEDGLPGPDNFVSADWASWETVLRVAVTAQSPEAGCGMDVAGQNNNQCVWIDVESDSAGNKLRLAAYRSDSVENMFIAAVRVVEKDPTDDGDGKPGSRNTPVYMDADGGVAKLEADEEDKIIFRLVNSTTPPITIDVENENPEFNDFLPEHETAFDDGDVEYTFSVTDAVSGIPEPEDLAGDTDGDGDYMPLVALISSSQCQTKDPNDKAYSKVDADLTAGSNLWCKSDPEIRQVVDDRDFDEIDDGFEVATKVVLRENMAHYVTFIVCDNAGNCAMYTPDENKEKEALAEITIDDQDPDLIEARTGVKWDSTDSKYDDDPTFIQLLFNDLTALDPTSVEADDFDIEGHTIKAVYWYDVSDNDDDTAWGDGDDSTTPSRYAMGGSTTLRGHPLRQSIRNTVFIELEDELAPDETPDVTIVPNGVLDSAGNEQDDDDTEADDWIAPSFTVVSMVSPGTPEGSSNQLAGDGDEVMITLTSNERIQQTRPIIEVTYVNAPSGCVNTLTSDDYARGQIKTGGDCGKNATGGTLGTTFERISNTEWVITVDEPDDTGYYNVYIKANDRSEQRNLGTEGIASSKIATKFFERDGDVNSDDAHYFQGDINLSNPGVRVSGVQIEETEPSVEFKTPLFVELDFTRPYIKDCANDISNDERAANCYAESDEYAKDSFDAVTVTSFTLNGTDMTDMVKTTDNETFLVSIEGIAIGDHEIEIQAMDQAGNTLDKALSVEFEVEERDDFSNRLSPGWNLVSLPGEPADSSISVVFGSDVEVRTVYTYDPIMPGGWMVAVRETVDADWQGDLTEITARRGYWVLSDAIQDWDVAIPRLAGGAVGSGTPIQPPVIALYAGWNLVPVIDVTGNLDAGDEISAQAYLQSLDDGLDLARVLGFNTITNEWRTIKAPETGSSQNLAIGEAYWVFVRQAASLVPGY